MNQSLEWPKCNLCGEDNFSILFKEEGINVVKCKICGLVYKTPRRALQNELEIYRTYPLARESKENYIKKRMVLFKYLLYKVNQRAKKGKLLDLGCQFGYFLDLARREGWQVFGVDVSGEAIAFAKEKLGLNVYEGTLKEAKFPDDFFDVITLWDALEHLSDPFAELLEIKRILKGGGQLVFRDRNAASHVKVRLMFGNLAKKLKINPTVFHLCTFSAKTAKMILKKAGFEDIKVINSKLTIGDPFGAGRIFGQFGVKQIKKITYSLSQLIFYLSGGLAVVGPSLLAFAKKPQDDSGKDYAKN
ncbi:MAG: class I SAM-dependent methyltransferase [Candidatus Omnitrophica bacterium]|nr:class I SAM-dependent methyltransferase [Candidatus Omnitrophota bacterium]